MRRLRHRRRARADRVFVHQYQRFRFGRWEDVCAHFRSFPGQLAFDF